MGPHTRSSRRFRAIRLTERDTELLAFLAEHRMVLAAHVAELLGTKVVTATARLNRLAGGGYVKREPLIWNRPPIHRITARGLRAIGSALPPPDVNHHLYEHDAGVAWLWLAAHRGTFGPLREVITERRLRSHDLAREAGAEPLAVRRGGVGPRGGERLHYPDLLITTADGRRVALELELTPKGRVRLESILAGYGADPRIDGVLYLITGARAARHVEAAARRVGVRELLHFQRVSLTFSPGDGAAGRGFARGAGARGFASGAAGRGFARGAGARGFASGAAGRGFASGAAGPGLAHGAVARLPGAAEAAR